MAIEKMNLSNSVNPAHLPQKPAKWWQCCLAGSSKTAPRILIFSIAVDANYSYEVKNSEIWAPAFYKHNNSFIAAVLSYVPCVSDIFHQFP